MDKQKFRTGLIVILSAFFLVFLFKSFSPWGLKAIYSFRYPGSGFIKNILNLNTVLDLGEIKDREIRYLELDNDKATFSLIIPPSPQPISKAKISVDFKTDKEAKIDIDNGLSDKTKVVTFFEPTIQGLSWKSLTKDELTLYQKNENYADIDSFLNDPNITSSDGKGVGLYDYEIKPVIKNSELTNGSFETSSKLRGVHTIYTYVSNNKLEINISKIDLNQYQGSDSIDIIGSFNNEDIFHETIKDDGIDDNSNKKTQVQEKSVQKILENGIYKISINAGIDSIITDIKINQKLVVFDHLFLADNPVVYPIMDSYKTNTIYTDSKKLSFALGHESQKQSIKINDSIFEIDQKNKSINLDQSPITEQKTSNKLNVIESQINDIGIYSESVLAFSEENFFKPYLSLATAISSLGDINSLDYIIGKYKKAIESDGWYHQNLEIPISPDFIEDNRLDFSIYTNDKSTSRKSNWLKLKNLKITLE